MWALDDEISYLSLIQESDRDITGWTLLNATALASPNIEKQPFPNSNISLIEADVPVSPTSLLCTSPDIVNFASLDPDIETFCIGAYFYSNSPYITKVAIGFEYTDILTSNNIQQFKEFETTSFNIWSFISGTFEVPADNTSLRVLIKFFYEDGGASSSDYQFYINGITVGQLSENFNAVSLGAVKQSLPADVPISGFDCILADSYGLAQDPGYYLVKDNYMLSNNTGIPIVFGASNITKLKQNNGDPSLIVPGKGFLNKVGQFKDYTVEFWARIDVNTYEAKRIFGPITSTDGLYVEGGFLTLSIGKSFSSYFVGEWSRPMLIQVKVIQNSASVFINGSQAISMVIDTDTLDLPSQFNESGTKQDWLGFYAYEDVSPFEIDCVAIYPYSVPVNVAKRRFVYGQAVISPESINSSYDGTEAFIDYPFADYTANYNYPDFAKWQQATFDNLVATPSSITTPSYSLPNIFINNRDINDLYLDNKDIQDDPDYKFISFRPNSFWDLDLCYFNFQKFNLLSSKVNAVYGVFSTDNLLSSEILIKIYNSITGNSFTIERNSDEIRYYFTYNGITSLLHVTNLILSNEKFAVGIKIDQLVDFFGGNLLAFFGNLNGMGIYVGGDGYLSNQFTGRIYSFGLCTVYNSNEIKNSFEENGIVIIDDPYASGYDEPTNALTLLNHVASYTLIPMESYSNYFLDISVAGYWQDYMPLSYFGQFIKTETGDSYYDLDFLQYNISYPPSNKLVQGGDIQTWTYDELKDEYSTPVQLTYEELDDYLLTGWNSYQEMSQKSISFLEYDTQDASVRSYVTFQYIDEGANAPKDYFSINVPAKEGKVLDVSEYTDWDITRFEVLDNTLIYPDKTVDFNEIAMVYSLEFKVKGILSKPIAIKKLQIASQAFNSVDFNPVGTRFGIDVYPYKKVGIYYDYKSKNPYSIYKGSTPYLYLTNTSGIEVRGVISPSINRGIAVPINTNLVEDYKISAVQMWIKSNLNTISANPVKVFEISTKRDVIKFYMQSIGTASNRAKIYAISTKTGEEYKGISYYWNGNPVREPFITTKEWGALGIKFAPALDFDAFIGEINLNGPLVFNNVAFYQANNLQQIQGVLTRPWADVLSEGITDFTWDSWNQGTTDWEDVLIIGSTDIYGVDPSIIYETYIGTNKVIVDDNQGIEVSSSNLSAYIDIVWETKVGTPV
jgi:hypothetical protein